MSESDAYLDDTILLNSDLEAPAAARRFIDEHRDHLPPELVADAALLVSELVTNAVRYGAPQVTLRVRLDAPLLGVLVHDEGSVMPPSDIHSPAAEATGGRGLVVVDRLSFDWGVIPTSAVGGKTVWFRLSASGYPTAEPV